MSNGETIERSSATETFVMDDKRIELCTSQKNVVCFRFGYRPDDVEDILVGGETVDGMLRAEVPLNRLTEKGTIDLFVVFSDASEKPFGAELALGIAEDAERSIGIMETSENFSKRYICPYIQYNRSGISVFCTDDLQKIHDHIFGLVHLRLHRVQLQEGHIDISGEFYCCGQQIH